MALNSELCSYMMVVVCCCFFFTISVVVHNLSYLLIIAFAKMNYEASIYMQEGLKREREHMDI